MRLSFSPTMGNGSARLWSPVERMRFDLRLRGRHDVGSGVRQRGFPGARRSKLSRPSRARARAVSRPIPAAAGDRQRRAVLLCEPQFHRPGSSYKNRARPIRWRMSQKHCRRKMLGEIPRPTGRFADLQAKDIVAGKSPTEHRYGKPNSGRKPNTVADPSSSTQFAGAVIKRTSSSAGSLHRCQRPDPGWLSALRSPVRHRPPASASIAASSWR